MDNYKETTAFYLNIGNRFAYKPGLKTYLITGCENNVPIGKVNYRRMNVTYKDKKGKSVNIVITIHNNTKVYRVISEAKSSNNEAAKN